MRAVVQRVKSANVTVNDEVIGKIEKGFMVLLGISKTDTEEDIKYIKDKIVNLRVFEDDNEKMNLSLRDVNGELLIVSQFTLYGDCRKGRRPNFMEALSGDEAEKLYDIFVAQCKAEVQIVATGKFGADMDVSLINDGPVTILLDSRKAF
ncbi:D-aminoacyl-tRNA deacylase [Clostridium oryzae]|uniref:D-aminoacyl-tRNA deacylase n=1 Tax=Clostridium oryzae TaxID=1450648 RepID=A0A1V4IVZ6_9CLOT|nr:D-aminoacyl-tRNA deacylase [Clostridium oryzae]OPJ63587.1 D-tyrosyl-tRNA(Tyr) deacylase [Clostridium oryzae]